MTADAAVEDRAALGAHRSWEVWRLALPIIGAMSSQNVLNLVDTAMVSRVGPAALAGVGLGSFLHFMAFSTITGLSAAVQATAARRCGEGRYSESAVPLNGGILLSLAIGIPLSLVLFLAAPWIFGRLNHDPEVVRQGSEYLQCRLLGVAAVGINFSFRGYWSAVKRTTYYLCTLGGMCALNIALDWVLIFGHLGAPALGARGAGLANLISTLCGSLAYCSLAWFQARDAGFFARLPEPAELRSLLRLGLPTCLQQLLFSTGFVVLFWIIGHIGTAELAVTNVLVNITLTAILPGMGFGLAAATFCGQALGRHEPEDAYRWAWDVFRASWWVYAGMALPMLLLTDAVLGMFFGHDTQTTAQLTGIGRLPLRLIGLGVTLDGLGFILMQALLGVGASRPVMLVSVGLQWGLFLPLAYLLGVALSLGLTPIWGAMTTYRAAQTLILISLWRGRRWARIKV
ncbi:MAG: MATE family efflux transporter [Nevskia sp.]|nr:MATE family efflux transporter [Nevskia sp.]